MKIELKELAPMKKAR